MPSERRELRLEVAEREDLLRRLVGLELVAVDDDGQPRQAVVGRALKRFEVLALLELAVSDHDDDAAARCRAAASPRRCRGPSRCPCRAIPSSPRCRARGRSGARRARPAAAAAGASRWAGRRANGAPRRAPARRGPSTRSTRRDRGGRSRARAVFRCSWRRKTTMSIALKLEPRWPEPARLTAVSAFSRHMSAMRGSPSSVRPAHGFANSVGGTSASSATGGRGGRPRSRRRPSRGRSGPSSRRRRSRAPRWSARPSTARRRHPPRGCACWEPPRTTARR